MIIVANQIKLVKLRTRLMVLKVITLVAVVFGSLASIFLVEWKGLFSNPSFREFQIIIMTIGVYFIFL